MAEYIERSYIRKKAMLEPRYTMQTKYDSDIMLKLISEAPAADVAPVRYGRWLDMQEDDSTEGMWRCSVCGEDRYFYEGHPIEYEFRFCPNCGARMDLGGAEDA